MKRPKSTHPPIIALTGTIGSGKSTVANLLHNLGATLIEADQLAREAVLPGSQALDHIVKVFGPSILDPDGKLNRKALGKIVFSDDRKRAELESIVHPEVRHLFTERVASLLKRDRETPQLIVYEVPLLFESKNTYPEISSIVVVSASPERCIARIMARDRCTRETAMERLNAQLPNSEKERRADIVIYNDGTLEELQDEVARLYSRLTSCP